MCIGDIRIEIGLNMSDEQATHPFTIGIKNFVIIESDNGAKTSTIIHGLVETAKVNRLNTYKFYELLLTEIPKYLEKNMSLISPGPQRYRRNAPVYTKKSSISKVQKI